MRVPSLPLLLLAPIETAAIYQTDVGEDTRLEPESVSFPLFTSLERFSRLVDITYCVGTTGLSQPFSCISRCKDFPELELDTTWNTGVLMSDSCGYIAVDHSTEQDAPAIVVAFRGTYSLSNTIVDLSTIPQEYVPYQSPGDSDGRDDTPKCSNCTVHMGFWESWNSARAMVLPHLKELRQRHPDYTIHLLGHSLGGAVAALAALELKISFGWHNILITTFGEPRVGNQELSEFIDQIFDLGSDARDPDNWSYRRLTHVNDPVPLLPLSEWGYRSHAGEIFITKSELAPHPGDLRVCHGDYDEKCSGGADGNSAFLKDLPELEIQAEPKDASLEGIPTRFKLWQLLFAHRDYFWRLGLCVPGGDPADWGRNSEL
ncbi:hypothetical protein MKZ38_003290 [Zalerion maritima]|uniref:Fungal lipase-type domain-containing protein n=1 Tax=Zalerion maritima TaxID=339359 RepID=A0AAD5RP24_9PEZI|nr:hypothetical protein MKZ38_003290 [Zalerion maritima]